MIFFLRGRPRPLFMYQTSLTCVSFASEPELQKNTFEVGTGADFLEFLGELDRRIVTLGAEQMRERQFTHLLRGRPRPAPRCRSRAPCTRARPAFFYVGLAVVVVDEHALAALEHQRSTLAQCREIGIGMDQGLDVAGREIAEDGHAARSSVLLGG